VAAIATRNKLTSSVIPELAGIKIPHIDQSQESDAKFLTRLAERNGGEVSVKAGKLLFLKAGRGLQPAERPFRRSRSPAAMATAISFPLLTVGHIPALRQNGCTPKTRSHKSKRLKRKPKEQHLRALQHPKPNR
jgi:hypothetical protein